MMMNNIENKDGAWYLQADEAERAEFRDWVTGVLRMHDTEVEFVKTDGTLRKMSATLNPLLVPPAPEPKILSEGEVAKVKKANPEVCSVWDIEAKGWRSFRFDKVKSIRFTIGS
jgi:hypothetical protein